MNLRKISSSWIYRPCAEEITLKLNHIIYWCTIKYLDHENWSKRSKQQAPIHFFFFVKHCQEDWRKFPTLIAAGVNSTSTLTPCNEGLLLRDLREPIIGICSLWVSFPHSEGFTVTHSMLARCFMLHATGFTSLMTSSSFKFSIQCCMIRYLTNTSTFAVSG